MGSVRHVRHTVRITQIIWARKQSHIPQMTFLLRAALPTVASQKGNFTRQRPSGTPEQRRHASIMAFRLMTRTTKPPWTRAMMLSIQICLYSWTPGHVRRHACRSIPHLPMMQDVRALKMRCWTLPGQLQLIQAQLLHQTEADIISTAQVMPATSPMWVH
jgi:hypothetical protein